MPAFLLLLISFSLVVTGTAAGAPTVLYLPLIGKTCTVPIPNGNFEQGRTQWTETSNYDFDLVPLVVDRTYIDTYSPGIAPRSGNWAGWLCGIANEVASLKQRLSIPASCPTLTYWHWIDSDAPCGVNYADVIVTTASGNFVVVDSYELCSGKNTGKWALHQVNLSAYAGQSVELEIQASCTSQDYTSLFLDDLAFQRGLIR